MTPSPDTTSSLLHVASNTPLPNDSSDSLRDSPRQAPTTVDPRAQRGVEELVRADDHDSLAEDSYLGRYEGDESGDVDVSEASTQSASTREAPQAGAQRFVFKPREQAQGEQAACANGKYIIAHSQPRRVIAHHVHRS